MARLRASLTSYYYDNGEILEHVKKLFFPTGGLQ